MTKPDTVVLTRGVTVLGGRVVPAGTVGEVLRSACGRAVVAWVTPEGRASVVSVPEDALRPAVYPAADGSED